MPGEPDNPMIPYDAPDCMVSLFTLWGTWQWWRWMQGKIKYAYIMYVRQYFWS